MLTSLSFKSIINFLCLETRRLTNGAPFLIPAHPIQGLVFFAGLDHREKGLRNLMDMARKSVQTYDTIDTIY